MNYLLSEQFNVSIIDKICSSRFAPKFYSRSISVLEFIMLKRRIIFVPDIHLECTDIINCITAVCSSSR